MLDAEQMSLTNAQLDAALTQELLCASERRPDEAVALRRKARAEKLHRVVPGRFVDAPWWSDATEEQRHVVRARAVHTTSRVDLVFSHHTAGVLLCLPFLAAVPDRVQYIRRAVDNSTTTQSGVLHSDASPELADSVRFGLEGLRATGLARTTVDLAVSLTFDDAVMLFDNALRDGVARAKLDSALHRRGPKGKARALRALAFADGRSGSAGESLLRLRLFDLGAPTPTLQHRFDAPGSPPAFVDFWFEEQGVIVEFDGRIKFSDPAMRNGRSAEQVLWDEKRREDRLRALPQVRAVVRVLWSDLYDLPLLASKLRAAGIPLRPGR